MLFVFALSMSCRKKCTEEASKKSYLDPQLNGYFGMFKKENYWVYENQDKSKRDSLYVTAYDRKFILDKTACDDVETLEFTLKENSKEIVANDLVCMRGKTIEIYTQNCSGSTFFSGDLLNILFYGDTILTSGYVVKKMDILRLNNQQYSHNIIEFSRYDTLYMQKGLGIIGWKKNNQTYNLVKYNLQP